MLRKKSYWIILALVLLSIAVPLWLLLPRDPDAANDPWETVPANKIKTDHTHLLSGPFASGSEVTVACLACHPDAAKDMMKTSHWSWESEPFKVASRPEPVRLGKKKRDQQLLYRHPLELASLHRLPRRLRLERCRF